MKAFPCLGALLLSFSILALPAFPDHRQKMFSSTKAFLIDGKRYLLEKAAGGDMSLIHPYFEDALREDNEIFSSAPIAIPKGLHPEHVVQLISDSGPVELVVGSMDARGTSARNRLPESEWKHIESVQGQQPISVALRKYGKETFLVFLEEKRGKFLLVRKPE